MVTISPNLFPLSHSDLFYLSGVVCPFICRLLGLFFPRRVTLVHTLIGSLLHLVCFFRKNYYLCTTPTIRIDYEWLL